MGNLGTRDLKDSLAPQDRRGLEGTICPVCPETLVPPERKETLEMQVTEDCQVLQVFVASLDLMDLKGTEAGLDYLDHLDDKDLQVLLVIPEKKDLKGSVLVEIQVLRRSQALLDSGAQRETLISGPRDPLAFRDDRALRDLKEFLAPRASTD